MKHKKGDKVKVKSRQWYDEKKDEDGNVFSPHYTLVAQMAELCGKTATITAVHDHSYYINIDKCGYNWTDGMFEDNNIMEKTLNITIPEGKKPKMTENENGCVIEWLDEEKTFEDYVMEFVVHMDKYLGIVLVHNNPQYWCKMYKYGLLQLIADDLNEEKLDWQNANQGKYEIYYSVSEKQTRSHGHASSKSQAALFTESAKAQALKIVPAEFLATF